MVITDEQRKILLQFIPNAMELLANESLYELELAIDAQITENGMDEEFELNELGLKLQLLYDQIYNQNN